MIEWEAAYKLINKLSPRNELGVKKLIHFIFDTERIPLAKFLE
jgi:hypothetical protein